MKIRIESNLTIYEISEIIIIANMVKLNVSVNESKYIHDHIRGAIIRKVNEFPPILNLWLQTKMSWEDIKIDAVLISGPPIEITDWNTINITLVK